MADIRLPRWVYNDGGRADAGFHGETQDCAIRAVAIATDLPYRFVYDQLFGMSKTRGIKRPSPRNGVDRRVLRAFMEELGWTWIPTMGIGTGCTVHLTADELPGGCSLVVNVSKHTCAVIDGVIHDTHDPSRNGTRCVYGYFIPGFP